MKKLKIKNLTALMSLLLVACNSGGSPNAQTNSSSQISSTTAVGVTTGTIICYDKARQRHPINVPVSGTIKDINFELSSGTNFDQISDACKTKIQTLENNLLGARIAVSGKEYVVSDSLEMMKWIQNNPNLAEHNIRSKLSEMVNGQDNKGSQFFTDMNRTVGEISFSSAPGVSLKDIFAGIDAQNGIIAANSTLEDNLINVAKKSGKTLPEKNAAALADFMTRYINQSALESLFFFTNANSYYITQPNVNQTSRKLRFEITEISADSVKFKVLYYSLLSGYLPYGTLDNTTFNEAVPVQYRVPFDIDTTNYTPGIMNQTLKVTVPKIGYNLYEILPTDAVSKQFVEYSKNAWLNDSDFPAENQDAWSLN